MGAQSSTIVFPMPIDLMKPVLEAVGQSGAGVSGSAEKEASEPGDRAIESGRERALEAGASDETAASEPERTAGGTTG
jgi:hypothetical protein